MKENENSLLRLGSFCILIGGIVGNLFSIFSCVVTMLAMSSMDDNTLYSLSSYMAQESGGLLDGSDALNMTRAVVITVIAFAAAGLLVDVIVGIMGLSRSKKPQKYKFFLGWGIVLLIVGFFSIGELFSLRGIFIAFSGIVGPIMYMIGGIQQNRAANADSNDNI